MSNPTESNITLGTDPYKISSQGEKPNVANKQDQKPLFPSTQIGDGQSPLSFKTCDPNLSNLDINEAHNQGTDNPHSAEGKKPECNENNPPPENSQSLEANPSSGINPAPVGNEDQLQDTQIEQMERDFKTEVGNLKKEAEELKQELNNLSQKVEKPNLNKEDLQLEIDKLKKKIENFRAKNEKLEPKLGNLKGKLTSEIKKKNESIEKGKQSIETEIEAIKSKTTKTVLGLTASGLAIGGAAVACLILLPALPIYACGLLGAAIGAAIGLLIFAIVRGMSGRAERKDLEKNQLAPIESKISTLNKKLENLQDQLFDLNNDSIEMHNEIDNIQAKLDKISLRVDSVQEFLSKIENNIELIKIEEAYLNPKNVTPEDTLHLHRALQLNIVGNRLYRLNGGKWGFDCDKNKYYESIDKLEPKLVSNLDSLNFRLDDPTSTSGEPSAAQQTVGLKDIPKMLKEGKKVMWNQALPDQEPAWIELTNKNIESLIINEIGQIKDSKSMGEELYRCFGNCQNNSHKMIHIGIRSIKNIWEYLTGEELEFQNIRGWDSKGYLNFCNFPELTTKFENLLPNDKAQLLSKLQQITSKIIDKIDQLHLVQDQLYVLLTIFGKDIKFADEHLNIRRSAKALDEWIQKLQANADDIQQAKEKFLNGFENVWPFGNGHLSDLLCSIYPQVEINKYDSEGNCISTNQRYPGIGE